MVRTYIKKIHDNQLELWKTDRYLRSLENKLASIRLLSLDIFDTLLFRACALPTDVFKKTAEKAMQKNLFKRSVSLNEFKEIRIKAENDARRKHNYEVTLERIYDEIPASLCDSNLMLELELEVEQEVCYINPNMASLLYWCKERGIQVAFVSDMYLSSKQMSTILTAAGLVITDNDSLLISNEKKSGKADGKLFDRLLEIFPDLTNHDLLHIGDNISSDIAGAGSRGIQALHYTVIPERFESSFHWDYVRHVDILPGIQSLRKLAGASALLINGGETDKEELFFFQFGATVLGPFLQGLCDWVIDVCVQENRTEVHPLMREAYLLGPMLEESARMRGVPLIIKPIYLSRQATYLASIDQFDAEDLEYLLNIDWANVGDLFTILDITEEASQFQSYLDISLVECNSIMLESGLTVVEKLKRFLLESSIKQKIQAAILKSRELFVDYLHQECSSIHNIVTVDIGFNGTIQKAIESVLRLSNIKHEMIHLLAVGSEKIGDHLYKGMNFKCFLGSCGENSDLGLRIMRSPAFLEELMMGEFGSTLRYERNLDGIVSPITAALLAHSERELFLKKTCQRGAFAFQRYYSYLRKCKPNLEAEIAGLPREWSKILHRVIEMPTPEEAQMLGKLTHQENLCGVQISSICNPVEDKWFSQGEERFIDICNYGPSTLNAFWPQGMITLKSPFYLYKFYLRIQDQFNKQSLLLDMIQKVKLDGVTAFHIVGKNAFAEMFKKTALFHGLTINSCIDPKLATNELQYLLKDGIASHNYVIASLTDIELFRNEIVKVYQDQDVSPLIYDFGF